MSIHENLLGGPAPTLLPDDPDPRGELSGGADAYDVVRRYPTASRAWAQLADQAWAEGRVMESYAFARVGYHRGLDALRRNGWKGFGPVPWEHEPNQGFLRCVFALQRASAAINEEDEAQRCAELLTDCDPAADAAIRG